MQTLIAAVLAFASICLVSSYGPPPTKNKHRTTTTTISPIESSPDTYSPTENSVYPSGPGVSSTNFPPYEPKTGPSGGGDYWWKGPNSPFNPQQPVPSVSPGISNPPASGPAFSPGAPVNPSSPPGTYPSQGQAGGSYPSSGTSPHTPESGKPIDLANNIFLSSALGINKVDGCSSPTGGCASQPSPQNPGQYPGTSQGSSCSNPSGGCVRPQFPGNLPTGSGGTHQPPYSQGQPPYPGISQGQPQFPQSQPHLPGSSPPSSPQYGQPSYSGVPQGKPQFPGGQPQHPGGIQGQPGNPQYPGGPQGQPQYPGSSQEQPQYPGSSQYPGGPQGQQPQYPGGPQGKPQYPGSSQEQPQNPGGQPQQPGGPQSQPQYPGGPQGKPQYPGSSQGQPQYPGEQQPQPGGPQGKPQYPGSSQGQPQYPAGQPQQPGGPQSQPQYPGSSQGQPQYPGGQPQQSGGPQSQPQYPGAPQGKPQYPGSSQGQPQYPGGQPQQPGGPQGQPQYPGSSQGQPQYPGGQPQQPGGPQGQPQYPGSSQGQPQYPGGQPQQSGGSQGQPQYPGSSQGQPQYPGGPQGKPQYPGSSQGQPQNPGGQPQQLGGPQGQPQYPGGPQGQPQYPGSLPGQPQYPAGHQQQPGGPQNQPQYPGQPQQPGGLHSQPQQPVGSQYPGGQPQKPGSQQPQYPVGTPAQSNPFGKPQEHLPQGQPQVPDSPSSVYPGTAPGQSPKPQYPQYGTGSNNPPSGNKFPPPYPGASAPPGQVCNQPGYLCVTKSACNQGVLSQSGAPGRAGICNIATEVCCKIPTNQQGSSPYPAPTIGYGNGNKPGTNGVPIGGSIYDKQPTTSYATTQAPVQPYTGPQNTTPHPGCAAALKCVPITYCTSEGVMSNSPVYLTREESESRVPLTDCMNPETNIIGKCCRDPNYKDPWPAGMMMGKTPTGGGFDDGQYHPPGENKEFDDGLYHPEQETSGTISHQAGIYYDVTTPKGHTIKKPIGNFNQTPTPFPTKQTPGRLPAPVYEDVPEKGASPGTLSPPSNDILPPTAQGKPGTPYNSNYPGRPGFETTNPQQSTEGSQPQFPGSAPGQLPQQGYQTPSYPKTSTSNNPTQPGYQPSSFNSNKPAPNQPGQNGQPTQPGYQTPTPSYPNHQTPSQLGQNGQPTQPGYHSTSPSYTNQPTPGQSSTPGFLPGQPSTPSFSPSQPTQPGNLPSSYGNQPTTNQPIIPGYSPQQTGYQSPPSSQLGQTVSPNNPTFGHTQQPGTVPDQQLTNQNNGFPENPDQEGLVVLIGKRPGQSGYQPTEPDFPDDSNHQQPQQPNKNFPAGYPQPGSSCGIRHQAQSGNPEDAGETEFPWQALVTSASNKSLLCGAAIISENAVVTAAHCVEDFRSKDLLIKVGVWKLFSPSSEAEQTRPVAAIARHPKFNSGSRAQDLAILVISPSFILSERVDKICLPQQFGSHSENSNCVVTGWGRDALRGPIPNSVLHKVDVFFVDNPKCENALKGTQFGKYFKLSEGTSCALPKSSSDLCKVDVGGPLACDRGDGHYELAGINSWDVRCPADKTPTVFSNPDAEWIEQIINTPTEKLQEDEEKYNNDKHKGEIPIDDIDIDQKPGFALGYGKK